MHDRPRFIDTNIWLYAFIRPSDHRKTTAAHTVIEETRIITSSQVINEVCVNLLKRPK